MICVSILPPEKPVNVNSDWVHLYIYSYFLFMICVKHVFSVLMASVWSTTLITKPNNYNPPRTLIILEFFHRVN